MISRSLTDSATSPSPPMARPLTTPHAPFPLRFSLPSARRRRASRASSMRQGAAARVENAYGPGGLFYGRRVDSSDPVRRRKTAVVDARAGGGCPLGHHAPQRALPERRLLHAV